MSRHVVIGTAGHVDHGKTALVKALTGIDTDRFPEEQRRGITIDIGFAHLELDGDVRASVVDVPGHEDFIRNMVAGATGIDLALLVVAADEGIMPQTVEHLAILELLGVTVGAVAITKADLADPDWLELVRADLDERLRKTSIAWEPATAVSVITGQGLDDLKARLTSGASRARARPSDDLFRMPIDRVFSLPGAGTVVTGTTWSGSVRVGEQVSILPEGESGRVRSVEVHGERRDAAEPGRRTALALAGVERAAAARGSVAVSDPSWRPATTIDVELSLMPEAPRPLTQRTRIRLHLGTAEVIARVTPGGADIEPGASGLARLRLESPVVARWGDRGVVRSYSPVMTIGGCVVVDPWPPGRPRRPVADDRSSADPVRRIHAFASAHEDGIALKDVPVRVGVHRGELAASLKVALESSETVRLGDQLVAANLFNRARAAALNTLSNDHRERPLTPGMPLELLRQSLRPKTIGEHILTGLVGHGEIVLENGIARLPAHSAKLSSGQEAAGQVLLDALVAAGPEGRTLPELEEILANGPARALVEFLVRQGTAIRVGSDRYYERSVLDRLARTALAEIDTSEGATPARLREKLQLTRKYLIPLLEWLDLKGFTVRSGDARRLTPMGHKYLLDA